MAVLRVVSGPNKGLIFEVGKRPVSAGRSTENDIHLDDPSVSSFHARFVASEDRKTFHIEDMGSRNGTYLNGSRIETSELRFGDSIRIGVTEMSFESAAGKSDSGKRDTDSSVILKEGGSDEDSDIVWSASENILRTCEIEGGDAQEAPAGTNLEVLLEVSRQCNASLLPEEVLDRVLDILISTFRADRGFILLLEERPDGRYAQNMAAIAGRTGNHEPISVCRSIVDRVIESRSPVLSFDAMRDARFSASDSILAQNLRAVMCAPILREEKVVGLVHLDSQNASGLFGRKDLELLKIICDEAAISIENSRLYGELRGMADHNAAILTCLGDGVIAVDTVGCTTTVNRRAEEIFGLEASVMKGRPVEDLAPLVEVWPILKRVLETGERMETEEVEAVPGGGARRPLRVNASALRAGDELQGAVASIHDLTEERELAQKLRRSERLAAMGEAVAGVAHELRNPLTIMRGLTQLIMKKFGEDQKEREYAGMVIEGIDRASRIIRELLNYSRDTKLSLSRTDPGDLVRDVLQEQESGLRARGVELAASIPAELPSAVLDADKVRQVLVNLLSNAADACPEGGTIRVEVALADQQVEIRVSDTGVGMSPEVLSRVFDAFYTSKEEGIGLGLYISRKMVEQHGGDLFAESERGVGSVFTIRLPLEKRRRG
ncbi:MAG: FHA domain-containing protein [Planctomycetes bacterium]|nr:FHA domain-containing protein [Planctomycetota bacterium]